MFLEEARKQKRLGSALRPLAIAFALIVLSGAARAQETKVGETKDACDASGVVRNSGCLGFSGLI